MTKNMSGSSDSNKPEVRPGGQAGGREDSTLLYDAAALVALQKISDYLEGNLGAFQDPERVPPVSIPLHEYGVIEDLKPVDFRLVYEVRGSNIELQLLFAYRRDGNSSFVVPRPLVSERELVQQLRRDAISLVGSRVRGASAERQELMFEIRNEVPAGIAFEADSEHGVLRLELINVGALGKQCYLLKPEQVDAEFLNQLGRFIMHRRNAFLQETMLVSQGYPLSADSGEASADADDFSLDTVSLTPAADVIDFDPITFTGKREIILSYRDVSLTFDKYRSECLFGRKFPADIQVRSRYVSRAHATMRFEKNQFIFEDHSSNGTFIRIEDKGVRFLHQESMRLRGSGVISLGVSMTSEKRDLIYFEVVV